MFDASRSLDPDDATFNYLWSEGTNWFSTNAVTTNLLAVGTHTIELLLDDTFPLGASRASVTVEVISPADAVGILVGLVNNANLPGKVNSLLASLNAASASFERGNTIAGINQLQAFIKKVRAQVAPADPVWAGQLIQAAQQIIDALQPG